MHRVIGMTDWTSGYVADIGYTYGYSTELNPLRIRLAFLNAGLVVPEVTSAHPPVNQCAVMDCGARPQ